MKTMKTILTGLLIVASCGFVGCTNEADDSDAKDPSDDISLSLGPEPQVSGNPDKNGLSAHKVTHAAILVNKNIATSLVTNPLRKATNAEGTDGLTQDVLNEICDRTGESLDTFQYIVRCALPPGTTIQHKCPGSSSTKKFSGFFGLATNWGSPLGSCAENGCQELVSACVLAHSNFAGEAGIDIQLSSSPKNISQMHETVYLKDEGAYWGDIFDQSGTGQKRYGCQGNDAHVKYNSPAQGGSVELMSRTCGYFDQMGGCDICSSPSAINSNQCRGTHEPYLQNLDPAKAIDVALDLDTVRSCSLLCSLKFGLQTDRGYYDSCTTNGSGPASTKVFTVLRK